MSTYLNLDTWPRRDTFNYFRTFDKPYFNITALLDISALLSLREHYDFKNFLAYHYLALRVANEIEPFRYRIAGDRVEIHDVIHGASTILMPNETIAFSYFDYLENFDKFSIEATRKINEVLEGTPKFEPRDDHHGVIHFTTLPWVSFTSFSHARNWGREDSIPKIAFGRFTKNDSKVMLPVSVEVHHALMDGLHVGRFLQRLEETLSTPEIYLREATGLGQTGVA